MFFPSDQEAALQGWLDLTLMGSPSHVLWPKERMCAGPPLLEVGRCSQSPSKMASLMAIVGGSEGTGERSSGQRKSGRYLELMKLNSYISHRA